MRLLRKLSGMGSRPYPLDRERRRRVMVALAEKGMTISTISKSIGVARAICSQVINGRRLSPKTEQRIAEFLGKPAKELFPERSADDIRKMRKAEASKKKGKAA